MQSPSRSVQLSLDGNGSPLNQQLRPAQSSAAMDERTVAAAAGKSSKSVAKNKHLGGIDIPNRWKIISMLYQLPSPALISLQTGLDIDVLEELHRQQERRMKRMEYIRSQQTAAVETRAWWTMTTTNEQLSIHAHRRVHPKASTEQGASIRTPTARNFGIESQHAGRGVEEQA
ncbi:uncharacterized protein LOC120692412 isoform X3 [Panicum virgatum]|uniref:uncharacterized protein LOC120692412 isoform X3 n=1 Tax=Panicum virgatum TaxID=38727 RepID=UPI0019D532F6|nr:uncharacterized protein LOC120692412 isoform X3 [Panicum virgatum]